MTRNEAYKILLDHCDDEPMIIDAVETPIWWVFSVAPKGSSLNAGIIVGPRLLVHKEDKTVVSEDDVDMKTVFDRSGSATIRTSILKILYKKGETEDGGDKQI